MARRARGTDASSGRRKSTFFSAPRRPTYSSSGSSVSFSTPRCAAGAGSAPGAAGALAAEDGESGAAQRAARTPDARRVAMASAARDGALRCVPLRGRASRAGLFRGIFRAPKRTLFSKATRIASRALSFRSHARCPALVHRRHRPAHAGAIARRRQPQRRRWSLRCTRTAARLQWRSAPPARYAIRRHCPTPLPRWARQMRRGRLWRPAMRASGVACCAP